MLDWYSLNKYRAYPLVSSSTSTLRDGAYSFELPTSLMVDAKFIFNSDADVDGIVRKPNIKLISLTKTDTTITVQFKPEFTSDYVFDFTVDLTATYNKFFTVKAIASADSVENYHFGLGYVVFCTEGLDLLAELPNGTYNTDVSEYALYDVSLYGAKKYGAA